MPYVDQIIEGFGLRLRFVRISDELLAMEAEYDGSAGLPLTHVHPRQAERFAVLAGVVQVLREGIVRRYIEGEVFEIPAGTPHQFAPVGPALVRWEVRPGLRTAEFFERLYGDGPDSLAEAPSVAAFFEEFADEVKLTAEDHRRAPLRRGFRS